MVGKMRSCTVLLVDPLLTSLTSLGKDTRIVFFRKRQVIFSRDDSSNSIFYLQEGSVKLTVTSREGREAVIAVLDGGSFLGENAMAAHRPPRPHSAIALTAVRALRIDRDAMLRLLHVDADVCDAFMSSLIRHKIRMQQDLADNLLYSGEEQLAGALSSIANLYGDPELQTGLNLSRQNVDKNDRCGPAKIRQVVKHS
jgi:CRP/FNR family transcriptional regulator, cyclic AMP receptor protein